MPFYSGNSIVPTLRYVRRRLQRYCSSTVGGTGTSTPLGWPLNEPRIYAEIMALSCHITNSPCIDVITWRQWLTSSLFPLPNRSQIQRRESWCPSRLYLWRGQFFEHQVAESWRQPIGRQKRVLNARQEQDIWWKELQIRYLANLIQKNKFIYWEFIAKFIYLITNKWIGMMQFSHACS